MKDWKFPIIWLIDQKASEPNNTELNKQGNPAKLRRHNLGKPLLQSKLLIV